MAFRRTAIVSSSIFFSILLVTSPAFPHGGGLDAYGCHHNRKEGSYHCHRGQFAGESFSSKEEMLKKLGDDNAGAATKRPAKDGK
jgi:hypothetical protein